MTTSYRLPGIGTQRVPDDAVAGVVVPFKLISGDDVLTFVSTTTVFGTPVDITLSELAIESFFPADPTTAGALRRLADAGTAKEPASR